MIDPSREVAKLAQSNGIRFEVYIPEYYIAEVKDDVTGEVKRKRFATNPDLVLEFMNDTMAKFKGLTQSNPYSAAPFKGYWVESEGKPVIIDYLDYVFALVGTPKADVALLHFHDWKTRLEEGLIQDLILVVYYPIKALGDFLSSLDV